MSKTIIIDNNLLKSEIRALNNYVNRDEYNLNVVEVMVDEIQDIVKGLKPCEKAEGTIYPTSTCPHCGSSNVQCMFAETINGCCVSGHYLCEDCHKEFNV